MGGARLLPPRPRPAPRRPALVAGPRRPHSPTTRTPSAGLPGLGRYTRNAVLSQAFDRRLPILEANSQRVLSRLFGRRDDPPQGRPGRWLWQAAEALLPGAGVGEFNQALMELGALVCTPTRPRCGDCPAGASLRSPPTRLARSDPRESAVLRRHGGTRGRGGHPPRYARCLLARRPAVGRWAGLWEFPHGAMNIGEDAGSAALRIVRELTALEARLGAELLTVRHGVTRFAITLFCFEAEYGSGEFGSDFYEEGRWIKAEELADYPVSATQRRLAQTLTAPSRQRRLF